MNYVRSFISYTFLYTHVLSPVPENMSGRGLDPCHPVTRAHFEHSMFECTQSKDGGLMFTVF